MNKLNVKLNTVQYTSIVLIRLYTEFSMYFDTHEPLGFPRTNNSNAEPSITHSIKTETALRLSFTTTTMPKKSDTGSGSINASLKLVIKSGKYKLGYRETLRTLRSGKSKLVIVSNNCPTVRQSEIEYYAMLSKTPVHRFEGGNTELGTACGRYFQVSMLTVLESGDSDILRITAN